MQGCHPLNRGDGAGTAFFVPLARAIFPRSKIKYKLPE